MTVTPSSGERRFLNRELSWLAFNERVLEEAVDPDTPLLERAKFVAIAASNLDEFFMVRVARLKQMIEEADPTVDLSGLTAGQQLIAVSERAHTFVAALYAVHDARTGSRSSRRTGSGSCRLRNSIRRGRHR